MSDTQQPPGYTDTTRRAEAIRAAFAKHVTPVAGLEWDVNRERSIGLWEVYLVREAKLDTWPSSKTGACFYYDAEALGMLRAAMDSMCIARERRASCNTKQRKD